MAFKPPTTITLEEIVKPYDHGYSNEEVIKIKENFTSLQLNVMAGHKPTLDEFKTVVVPHFRIHRTEEFILQEDLKVKKEAMKKPRKKKEEGEKVPKEKKVSKKKLKERYEQLQLKMFCVGLSDEEKIEFESIKI